MSPLTRLWLTAALMLALAAPAGPAPAQAAPPDTAERLRQLGGVPCPDDSAFTCVTLTVPLDHFNPADPRTLAVTFAVRPATGQRKGMFVVATGGPGSSGIAAADAYTAGFAAALRRRFDIVFFDQRGVALSGGLTCPAAAAAYYQTDSRAQTPAQEAALKRAVRTFSEACVAEMGNPELLPYLGTDQAIEDLELFRQVMQTETLWLYGESYGTQYAQTYAARHGERLAGLILDGTVDLTLSGFDYYAAQAQAFSDTLTATLEACAADPGCAPDLAGAGVAAYDQLAARLARRPLTYHFPLPGGGTDRRTFTLAALETVAAGQMYSEGDRMVFARALAAYADRQDVVPLARLLYASLGLDPETLAAIPDPTYSDAMYYAVECQDYGYPGATPAEKAENYLRAGDAVEGRIPRLAALFYGDLPCAYWPAATTTLTRPAPLTAEGIPTLVLGATADPATPVGNGRQVFERLSDGYLITKEGGPHVIYGYGNACPDDIVTDFLVKDLRPAARELTCEGVVVADYVPLAPRTAAAFANPLEALASVETEINYLPEYYYWDGAAAAGAGCSQKGAVQFAPDGPRDAFTLQACAFTSKVVVTGTGSYHPGQDRFVLDVALSGRWACELRYVRHGDQTRVTGKCDGKAVNWTE